MAVARPIAERTREAVRARPALYDALRAGVLNYAAAADRLDLDADADAVATALRRYGADLSPPDPPVEREVRVRMERGVGPVTGDESAVESVLTVGDAAVEPDGVLTAVRAVGDLEPELLERILARLRVADVEVVAAGMAGEEAVVVVGRRDGATALRLVEATLEDPSEG